MRLSRGQAWMFAVVVAGPVCGAASYSAPAKAADSDYKLGLAAWRKPGKIDNAACANCHGPDGLELAIYNFDDATLLRRARPHLADSDAKHIVGLIHAVRKQYHIEKKLDPMLDRPLQPTGRILPGKTASERDEAFGEELAERLPLLTHGKITTLEQAQAAADQVMGLNPWDLTIGVPFNRFSEDVFHGKQHASLAHWLPDVARRIPAQNYAPLYALQDAYLAAPTDDNLWKLYRGFGKLTKPSESTGVVDIAADKYRSLLLFQHTIRRERLGDQDARKPIAFGDFKEGLVPNPMWEVAETARRFQDLSGTAMGLSPQALAKKSGGPDFRHQMVDIQASWFWLGWLFDQGLNRTSANFMAARGDWLSFALGNSGPYPIHEIYLMTRKQLVANRVPEAWGGLPQRRKPEFDYLSLRVGGQYISDIPKEPAYRTAYVTFTSNCFRMNLLLMLDEWRRTKTVWFRDATLLHVQALTKFIGDYEPGGQGDADALRKDIESAIAACQEKT